MEQMKDYLEVRSEKMNSEILREKIKNEESKSAQNMAGESIGSYKR